MATSIRHRCDGCRRTDATLEVQERRIKPGGTNAPWETRFLCEPCTKAAILSADPPRKVSPLPGHQPTPAAVGGKIENLKLGDGWGSTTSATGETSPT